MNNDRKRLQFLLERLTGNIASKEEFDELFELINNEAHEVEIKALLMESLGADAIEPGNQERLDGILKQILAPGRESREAPIRRLSTWLRAAVAAAVIVLLGSGTYYLFFRKPDLDVVQKGAQHRLAEKHIPPGGNKAVLTLANGQTIILDSAHNGAVAQQGNVTVIKQKDGQLVYTTSPEKPNEALYNTLATPRGGQFELLLPDGSKVWLNAASSLRYPTAFSGMQRYVELTGEAYFDVAENKKMPFIVKNAQMEVEVLGTAFNMMCYTEEPTSKVTLVRGQVRVKKQAHVSLLKPGQQIEAASGVWQLKNPDLEEVLAWRSGLFQLKNSDLSTVMRQIARWYDVEVKYPHGVPDIPLDGFLQREKDLKESLEILRASGIRCRLEKNTLIIEN